MGHHLILRLPEEPDWKFRASPCCVAGVLPADPWCRGAGVIPDIRVSRSAVLGSPSRRATLAASSARLPAPLAAAARFRAGFRLPALRCPAMADRARVRRIRDRLREVYGRPAAPPHGQGLDELILTVLSQSTNDRNRDVAFLRLRERFAAWEAVRDAPERRGRGGDPPGRHLEGQVRADPGDPARARRRAARRTSRPRVDAAS